MAEFLQFLFSGLATGAVYALVAIGLTLIFNTTDVINFAQGSFLVVGGFAAISLHSSLGLPVLLCVVLAVIFGGLVGMAMYRGMIAPARKASVLGIVMLTLGIYTIIESGSLIIFGSSPRNFPNFVRGGSLRIRGAVLTIHTVVILGVTVLVALALWVFYKKTMIGQAMLACAIDPQGAALMGIHVRRMIMVSFGVAAGLGAVAGTLLAPITGIQYIMGFGISVKAFAAAVLGGLGNVPGAIVGGLTLGILESMVAGYGSTAYRDLVTYAIILVVLLALPSGLLGGRAERSHVAAGEF